MPDIEEDVEPRSAQSAPSRRPGFWAFLRQAARMQLERPVLFIIPVILAITIFLLDHLTGVESPDARDLAKSFAFPPLDTYSDLRLLGDQSARWILPSAVALRIGAVSLFLTILLSVPLTVLRFIRLAGVYLLGIVSFSIQFGLSALYVKVFERLVTSGESSPLPLILLFISPVIHGLFALLMVQLAVKAVLGAEAQITFKDPVLWLLAGLSTWIWFMLASRANALFQVFPTVAFGLGFAAVVVQSTLVCAAALRCLAKIPEQ